MAGYGYGISVSGTRVLGQAVASLIPSDGLSLWLKADAGVTNLSYNYASTIEISGTSNPSFAGTYTADSVPTYNAEEGNIDNYSLSGSEGRSIAWNGGELQFVLSSTESSGSFTSGDGANWSAFDPFVGQVIISGFTGIYSGANGTYNGDGNYFTRVGGGFDISGNELRDEGERVIATAPANYSGSWTPATYISSVTLTGAGTTVVNGVYTRTDSAIDESQITFFGSGGKNLYWNGDEWVAQSANEEDAYYLSDDLITWTVGEFTEGTAPAPTGATATSARSVGSPTSTSVTVPTGSISGSVTTTTVNTENVTGWADQSASGRNATPNNNYGAYSLIGGKSFITFDEYSNMAVPVIWDNVSFIGTVIVVARFASTGGNIITQEGDSGSFLFARNGGSNTFFVTTDEGDIVTSSVDVNSNTNYVIGTTFNTFTGSLYLNGASVGTGNVSSNAGTANTRIGEASSIAEMIVYDRVLTTPERQQVEAYLNTKYAIY